MYNVLIVEDDPIQIDWSKKVLSGMPVEVVYATSLSEVDALIRNVDFVLTDLEIPSKPSSKTYPDNGLRVFEYCLKEGSRYLGIGIISNFDHHCRCGRTTEDCNKLNNLIDEKLRYINMVGHGFEGNRGKIEYRLGQVNIAIYMDCINWKDYPAYVVNGVFMDNNSFHEISDNGPEMTNLLREGKVVFLKPWDVVLQALIDGAEKK